MLINPLRAVTALAASAAVLAGMSSAETFTASEISFRDITGTVEIKTTSGDEMDISIQQGTTYRQVRLEEKDGVVTVVMDPWKEEEGLDCCDKRITRTFDARATREMTTGEPLDEALFADYPTIEVSMPFQGDVEFIDARIKLAMERLGGALHLDSCFVYGETSDLEEAVVNIIHGSRLVMGNVSAGLEIDVSGDADLRVGDASMVDVDVAGPGDVILGDIDGMLDISIAGSGLVRAARLDGPMTTRIAGSGAVAVKAGTADKLRAFIDGSGAIFFGGAVTQPELKLYGSSEVRVDEINGRLTHHGSGAVYVKGVKVDD
ncbi:hypothetical protein PUV54_16100 [Hyphococcus flavus]|uniref:Auto-transporter adhesin head GIN domain-containing protein n=1 Tax=Hyphococcus flavus TaxID=1866326 RepID=A0AAE9ZBD5_9PROT|nr:hypothetical protein [Hyphococcus flavus]WDI31474.1 hypothetical protein PUV54_16100 [Hyphococcus flavus]